MITVPVPQNMYQQVVANIQSGEGNNIQVLGTPVQLAGGSIQGIMAKIEPPEQEEVPTSRGITITPVVTAATENGQVIQVGSKH